MKKFKIIKEDELNKTCYKCNGTGYIFEGKGKEVHTCIDCLKSGRLS